MQEITGALCCVVLHILVVFSHGVGASPASSVVLIRLWPSS